MNIRDLPVDYSQSIDFGDLISHECPLCGSNMLKVIVWFQDNVVSGYMTDAECLGCGSRFHAPTEDPRELYGESLT